ncbi:MAG: Mu-like prophage major head subunit gpT family protein [Phycisphaeraceae bacterium]|nr:Mu-like prophage major head subunit gpT family protein [Phycisphaeraceae bacterium]
MNANTVTDDLLLTAAEVEIEAAGKDVRPKISVVAYTGRIMRVPGWGDIAIDLAGLDAGGQVPLLADHDASVGSVVGHGEPAVANGRLVVAGVVSGAGEPARHVVEMARGGFQFQASVGVAPTEHERVKPNQSVEINGRSLSSPSGFTLVRKGRLREVSITPLGADAETSVAIAASRQGRTNMADIANEDQIRADERERLKQIEITCRPIGERDWGAQQKRVDDLRAKAIAGDITVADLRAGVLEVLRASRPIYSGVQRDNGAGHIPRARVIEAAILKRAGFAALAEKALGPACMEAADDLRVAHTLDLCRAALQHEGIDTPADREGMVRASLTTHTLTEALGSAVNKVLLDGYRDSPATWRAFAGVRSVPDFKTATAIRPSFTGSLQQLPPGGEFKHGGAEEATTQYKVDTYGKIFSIDRRDLINDDLSLFDSVARVMGQAAMRKLSDLTYDTLLSNTGAFFAAGNGNYITGADTNLSPDSLGRAIAAMITQRDAEGNDLDLRPVVLVVPPELQTTARAVLESEFIAAQTNLPTGNSLKNAVGLEVEPRLSNTKKYGNKASTKHWYLFAAPAASPLIVGFLNGQQTPTVEFFGLDQTVNKLAVSWRVYFDFGAALCDPRAAVRSKGEA